MKRILKKKRFINKWLIVAALTLVTSLLFAATLHVYGINEEYKAVSNNIQSINRIRQEAAKINYIHQVIKEIAATTVEPVVEVAAAPVEEAAEEAVREQEEHHQETYYEEVYYVEESFERDYSAVYEEYYSPRDLRFLGVIYAGDWRWTWYSQKVLPGGGLAIPGRHVDENGFVCDENGRICLASSDLAWGTVVSTPFGKRRLIYDAAVPPAH